MRSAVLAVMAAAILIIAGLLFWPSEGPSEMLQEENVEGALILHRNDSILQLRAYSPSISVSIRSSGSFLITIDNMSPDSLIRGLPSVSETTIGNRSIMIKLFENGFHDISIDVPEPENEFVFYVIGDTHGYPGPLEEMLANASSDNASFVLHCGDLTPSSTREQYEAYLEQIAKWPTPIFTTPGNHDARDDILNYSSILAPAFYSFQHGGALFISLPSPHEMISHEHFLELEQLLSSHLHDKVFVFTHIPPLQSASGRSMNGSSGERFHELVAGRGGVVFN
ncbi:MAG: metallophosphoesterase, partial [Candidatus Thermoplasmatota archaeon]|nr:metallophosphoesterase [Candidatus Thermoplasmatota archaeon]